MGFFFALEDMTWVVTQIKVVTEKASNICSTAIFVPFFPRSNTLIRTANWLQVAT